LFNHLHRAANPTFSTGSTLPFTLTTDAGAVAGPLAPDGGLMVVANDASEHPVTTSAEFTAGPTSGTSSTPLGGTLSQTIMVPNDTSLTFEADVAYITSIPVPGGVDFQLLVNGLVVLDYNESTGSPFIGSALWAPLMDVFTTFGPLGGMQSITIGVHIGTTQPPSANLTEYIDAISVVNTPAGGSGGNPPSVPEPGSIALTALGMALVGFALAGRTKVRIAD
jgi:PEP-CTERM motif